MAKAKQRKKEQLDIAAQNFREGSHIVSNHPLFYPMWQEVTVRRTGNSKYPVDGFCYAASDGCILCNPKRRAEPEQWARMLAHCLLHFGMEHFKEKENPVIWNNGLSQAIRC
ncbi:MAG: hypothetical protein FWG42_09250 [Clostridiales bacterium]|nr:hypothetical protein [Clostridiales bacterium]